jgi:hypothetical protein
MTMQYAKSTDLEVIATIERNHAGEREAGKRINAWITQFGTDGFYAHRRWPGGPPALAIRALALDEKPVGHGVWVWGYQRRGVRPGKKNPLLQEMEALKWTGEAVPGLDDQFEAANPREPGFGFWMLDARPFIALDAAWVMLSMLPNKGEFGSQWVEVKASEAHAAKESYMVKAADQ